VALPFLCGCADSESLPGARAAFVGAGLSTTRAHFVRAIMEGVAYLLRDLLQCLEGMGVRVDEVCSLGGGAKSALWQQIKADACQKRFIRLENGEAALEGAAWLAARAVGMVGAAAPPAPGAAQAWSPTVGEDGWPGQGYARYRRAFEALMPLYGGGG
jgi:xylulokinase